MKDKEMNKKIDLIIRVVLIIVIILLLIHNCSLLRDRDKYKNAPVPNGNIDIIDIKCDSSGKCTKPTPIPNNGGKTIKQITSITFAQEKFAVKTGGKLKLIAIIKHSELASSKLTWSSSDPSIATVDANGVVRGLKEGEVTITVTSSNGKTAKCTVIVTNETVNVDSITLNPSSLTMFVGDTNQIAAIIKPDNATERDIVWSSSDSSVVSVDENGVIKGLKAGTATITVKTIDGKVVATSTITVKEVPVESITFDSDDISVKVGNTAQINATVKPDNATDKELIWTTSDSSIATVDSTGKVTGKKVGVVTIIARTTDGTVQQTVTITVEMNYNDDEVNVFDEDKDPITWNGSTDLNIFTKSIYNVDGFVAPESENTYQFMVRNDTNYRIKYTITFDESNDYEINMKYKLKKDSTYIISEYTSATLLAVPEYYLDPGENDTYYLDWKWISSSNDTSIGANPNASYGLKILVDAESVS